MLCPYFLFLPKTFPPRLCIRTPGEVNAIWDFTVCNHLLLLTHSNNSKVTSIHDLSRAELKGLPLRETSASHSNRQCQPVLPPQAGWPGHSATAAHTSMCCMEVCNAQVCPKHNIHHKLTHFQVKTSLWDVKFNFLFYYVATKTQPCKDLLWTASLRGAFPCKTFASQTCCVTHALVSCGHTLSLTTL